MMEQSVPGAAIGRLDQRLVLMPGKQVSTLVRSTRIRWSLG